MYQYWNDALAGRKPTPTLDRPQCGFYRTYEGLPVAFFPLPATPGTIPGTNAPLQAVVARDGGFHNLNEDEAREYWNWCCTSPVTEDAWRAVANGVGDWPDNAPGLGHNQPPDEFDPAVVIDAAETWLKVNPAIETAKQADQAAHIVKRLRAVYVEYEQQEESAKRPYMNFITTVRDKFRALRDPVATLGVSVKARLTPWLQAEELRIADERRKAQEAARVAQAAGERAPAAAPTVSAGRHGQKVGLRTVRTARIIDATRALRAAADETEIISALQTVANRFARNVKDGMTAEDIAKNLLPGTELIEERKAAG